MRKLLWLLGMLVCCKTSQDVRTASEKAGTSNNKRTETDSHVSDSTLSVHSQFSQAPTERRRSGSVRRYSPDGGLAEEIRWRDDLTTGKKTAAQDFGSKGTETD